MTQPVETGWVTSFLRNRAHRPTSLELARRDLSAPATGACVSGLADRQLRHRCF